MHQKAEIGLQTPSRVENLVELLHDRSRSARDKQVFSYVGSSGEQEQVLTYEALHRQAMAIAAELQNAAAPGERAVLLFPPGLDFIAAFFGCLYAGIIAVPAAIPGRNRLTASIDAIFKASRPSLVLSTADHRARAKQTYVTEVSLADCPWIAVDQIPLKREQDWRNLRDGNQQAGQQIAFLQYTSGSTSVPRGVMLSHENVLYNASLIQTAFHTTEESHAVFWLPLFHDMGLIGGVIQPIYCGGSCTLMAPSTFLQRPALWLETISRTRASVSGGPDFAYDLCARKISSAQREQLDLSSWNLAFLGAERIRPQTIDRFVSTFADTGFQRKALFPCYGLAEATLMVSGGPRQTPPVVMHVDAEALASNRIDLDPVPNCGAGVPPASDAAGTAAPQITHALVACGENLPGQRILIVDPLSRMRLPDGHVGEIWVDGPSVASGYFEDAEATAEVFQAQLAHSSDPPAALGGPFLRTGDLGFVHANQLFVTGRLKNLIIIRGRNHYPEDIEQTMNSAYEGLRVGYCAAFSAEIDNCDQLIVVQEVEPRGRNLDTSAAMQAIRTAIALRNDLDVYAVVLVAAGSVPKTSSGKTRRGTCRERYLAGELPIIASWTALSDEQADESRQRAAGRRQSDAMPATNRLQPTSEEIAQWLIERITSRLRLRPDEVQITTPFLELGLGSLDATEIAAGLEQWLGRQLSPTAIYNYPTISDLARWLATPVEAGSRQSDRSGRRAVGSREQAEGEHINLPTAHCLPPSNVSLLAEVRNMTDSEMEAFLSQQIAQLASPRQGEH
jgi:acyl-CoA synthetase (AMP-forming)/AMP-acid ligase II/acyl carrier protein